MMMIKYLSSINVINVQHNHPHYCPKISKISHVMGTGWEWELSAWEWELKRGSCRQKLRIVFCSYIVTWSKGSHVGGATAFETQQVALLSMLVYFNKLTLITLILEKLIGLL